MDFEKLKTFQQVAIDGSIAKAVRSLQMNKSSISRQLSQLEAQVEQKLFDRQGQKMVLTHEGSYLLDRASHILREVELTRLNLMSNTDIGRREFTISTTYAVASLWLTRFLHKFIDLNPKLLLNVKASWQPINLSLMEADVAIRSYCSEQDHLIQKHLRSWRLKLYASKEYINQFGTPAKIDDLDHHRIIILGNDPHVYPHNYACWPLIKGSKNGKYRKPFLLINSVEGMYNLVSKGVGIGNFGENFPYLNNLVPILPDQMFFDIDAYIMYPKQFEQVESIRKFEEFIFDQIRQGTDQ